MDEALALNMGVAAAAPQAPSTAPLDHASGSVGSLPLQPSRVDAIWSSLKGTSAIPRRNPSAQPPQTPDGAGEVPGMSQGAELREGAQGPSASALQDLLLGRVKAKKTSPGTSRPRAFAGPQSWVRGVKGPQGAASLPRDQESQAQQDSVLREEQGSGKEGEGGPAHRSTPPEGTNGADAASEEIGGPGARDRTNANVAATALAAAKAATSLVVDTSSKIEVKEIRHFAGQAVEVTQFIDSDSKTARAAKRKAEMQAASSRGLDSLLAQIEKKKKLNILDKTRKDWGEYKETVGVVDELEEYKRSGATYTEKQAFLSRADVREYEKERDLRMTSRSTGGS